VVVPKKNGNFRIYVDFIKLNVATKKDPYIPFTYEVLNMVERHDVYSFLDGCCGYHQISIAPEDIYNTTFVKLGSFYLRSNAFWSKEWTSYLPESSKQNL
jgi:hypothetical protein